MSSFYIGYLPQVPNDLRRFLRRVIAALFSIAATVSVTLVLAQQKFSPAVFEYSMIRDFEGTLVAKPYPSLLLDSTIPASAARYLLVGVGKHGFEERLRELDGHRVHLRAKLIHRGEGSMLEVMPGSIADAARPFAGAAVSTSEQGSVTLTGEIVDTKCFLGVMNPGRSKVHRDCATRCISGGIPPALLVENDSGAALYLLTDTSGGPISTREVLDRIGEPVTVKGKLVKSGDSYSIRVTDIDR